ncbi:hypothetical protein BDP27DRAFT_227316, partial [Rhodocollybia butyracea]
TSFPLAEIYHQATESVAATFVLLFIILLAEIASLLGCYVVLGRSWWALARDNATPFSEYFIEVSVKLSCPVRSTLLCLILCIGLGAIQLGSPTAFSDLVGSSIILTATSYLLAILPHLLSRLSPSGPNVIKGPFWMGPFLGPVVNALAVLFIILTNIIYCFPYFLPANDVSVSYNSVILVGLSLLTGAWWFIHGRKRYPGTSVPHLDEKRKITEDII